MLMSPSGCRCLVYGLGSKIKAAKETLADKTKQIISTKFNTVEMLVW